MPSLTLKVLPATLHRALKKRAAHHRRSLNSEIISMLEEKLASERPVDVEAMLKRERQLHAKMKIWATPEEIDRFKREGRE